MQDNSINPIFIVGAARSGTTLLRFMLSQHPDIFIPPQSGFIPRLFRKQPRSPLSRRKAIQTAEYIFRSRPFIKHWKSPIPTGETFVDNLPDRRPATILNEIYSQYALQHNSRRWGDKTPVYAGYINLLSDIFPEAQFIHILRDGRDAALSLMHLYEGRFFSDIYFAANNWKRNVERAQLSGQQLASGKYMELKYEELVENPDKRLQEICDFLSEDFFPEMARPHEMARSFVSKKNVHAENRKPIFTDSISKWKREMSPRDLRIFHSVAGKTLEKTGYETSPPGDMKLIEQLQLRGFQSKHLALESGRRVLQTLGVLNPN